MATQMSKKRKFVADGVFFVELKLTRELAEDDYSGVESMLWCLTICHGEWVQRIAAMVSYDMSWRVGAKNCEVVVSGKLRGQRAKSMKFKDGYT